MTRRQTILCLTVNLLGFTGLVAFAIPARHDAVSGLVASERALVAACFRNGRAVGWQEGYHEARGEPVPPSVAEIIAVSAKSCK